MSILWIILRNDIKILISLKINVLYNVLQIQDTLMQLKQYSTVIFFYHLNTLLQYTGMMNTRIEMYHSNTHEYLKPLRIKDKNLNAKE